MNRIPTFIEAAPDRSLSEQLLRNLCDQADVSYRREYRTAEVAEILSSCEYDVDTAKLTRLVERGMVELANPYEWTAFEIHVALARLEGQRAWKTGSKL